MTDCIIRAFGGCACKPDECSERPVTPAPVIIPSLKTQAITCLFIGFVVTIISAAVMETQVKKIDLINQEQYHANR